MTTGRGGVEEFRWRVSMEKPLVVGCRKTMFFFSIVLGWAKVLRNKVDFLYRGGLHKNLLITVLRQESRSVGIIATPSLSRTPVFRNNSSRRKVTGNLDCFFFYKSQKIWRITPFNIEKHIEKELLYSITGGIARISTLLWRCGSGFFFRVEQR